MAEVWVEPERAVIDERPAVERDPCPEPQSLDPPVERVPCAALPNHVQVRTWQAIDRQRERVEERDLVLDGGQRGDGEEGRGARQRGVAIRGGLGSKASGVNAQRHDPNPIAGSTRRGELSQRRFPHDRSRERADDAVGGARRERDPGNLRQVWRGVSAQAVDERVERLLAFANEHDIGSVCQIGLRMIARVRAAHECRAATASRRVEHDVRRLAHPEQAHLGQVVEAVFVQDGTPRASRVERGHPLRL